MPTVTETNINGIDLNALGELVGQIKADASKGISKFSARTEWKGAFLSKSHIDGWTLGVVKQPRKFTIDIDEPTALLGGDSCANPQEYLLASMNACMLNTFIAACSLQGVTLECVELSSEGELDLRGFLGIDPKVPPGYEQIDYKIRVKGDGTPAQYAKAHEAMKATSPNYYNMSKAIALNSKLIVE